MRINYFYLCLFFGFILSSNGVLAYTLEDFSACPICMDDQIQCPEGFEVGCVQEDIDKSEPKCIFYGNKYVPGCYKFVGIKKLDFDFSKLGLPSSAMIKVIGGGETYTLNRETVGCRKLDN